MGKTREKRGKNVGEKYGNPTAGFCSEKKQPRKKDQIIDENTTRKETNKASKYIQNEARLNPR